MSADGAATGRADAGRSARKSPTAYRTISEVSDELEIPQHVLRFWETKFSQVKPLKRGGGRRYYRPEDITLLRRIQVLLYKEGYTIKGVQKLLREGRAAERARAVMTDEAGSSSIPEERIQDPTPEEVRTPGSSLSESEKGDGDSVHGSATGHDVGAAQVSGDAEESPVGPPEGPAKDKPGHQGPDAGESADVTAEAPGEGFGATADADSSEDAGKDTGIEGEEDADAAVHGDQTSEDLPGPVRRELEAVLAVMQDLRERLTSDKPITESEERMIDGGGHDGN